MLVNKAQCQSLGLQQQASAWEYLACLFNESRWGADDPGNGGGFRTASSQRAHGANTGTLSTWDPVDLDQEVGDAQLQDGSDGTDGVVSFGPDSTPDLVAVLVQSMLRHAVMQGNVQFAANLALILGTSRVVRTHLQFA
jgi:hypothetical protein